MGLDQKVTLYDEKWRAAFERMDEIGKIFREAGEETDISTLPEYEEYRQLDEQTYNNGIEVWVGRKENHIQSFFEGEIDGLENCETYIVDVDVIRDLVARLEQVDADHGRAEELLPTQSGFFFGGTDYDEFYFEDIKYELENFRKGLDIYTEGQFFTFWSWW